VRKILLSFVLLSSLLTSREVHAFAQAFSSSLVLQIESFTAAVIPASGILVVNGSGGPGHLTNLQIPASPFATTGFVAAITDPAVFPIAGIVATAHNGPGSFSGSGGAGFGGSMSILGAAKVCLYGACGSTSNIANLTVPLSVVGVGGVATAAGAVNATVIGAPWTTGTAAVGSITVMGGVSPLSNTAALSGVATLVTPIFVSTNIGAAAVVPAFGILSIHFVPEPGTFALVGAGVVTLLALGSRRISR
jgi:hypothetical protein